MGFFDFLKGRKEKEALVQGLERTKEGFFFKNCTACYRQNSD